MASKFYFWSINNADFQQEKNAIEDEVNRLLPLVPDSTQKKWKTYLKGEDPQLFREIIGFWKKHDPFSSTELNERLIEHWKRIHQEIDQNARIPISPSLDLRFDKNEDIMIYFEAYNIPQEGSSFTYHFEKERWLLGPKKVEDKSEVTILAEDANNRDDQLFTINLDDLESGSYQLVFEFSPIDQTSTIEKRQKTVSFEIID